MSPRTADPELDDLTADIHHRRLRPRRSAHGIRDASNEADCLPCPATNLGETIETLSVSTTNGRQELIATCQHARHHHQITLLNIDINADQPASRLLGAYRHWAGAESPTT